MPSLGGADANDPPARGKADKSSAAQAAAWHLRPLATPFTASSYLRHRSSRPYPTARCFGSVILKSSHVGLYHPRFVALAK